MRTLGIASYVLALFASGPLQASSLNLQSKVQKNLSTSLSLSESESKTVSSLFKLLVESGAYSDTEVETQTSTWAIIKKGDWAQVWFAFLAEPFTSMQGYTEWFANLTAMQKGFFAMKMLQKKWLAQAKHQADDSCGSTVRIMEKLFINLEAKVKASTEEQILKDNFKGAVDVFETAKYNTMTMYFLIWDQSTHLSEEVKQQRKDIREGNLDPETVKDVVGYKNNHGMIFVNLGEEVQIVQSFIGTYNVDDWRQVMEHAKIKTQNFRLIIYLLSGISDDTFKKGQCEQDVNPQFRAACIILDSETSHDDAAKARRDLIHNVIGIAAPQGKQDKILSDQNYEILAWTPGKLKDESLADNYFKHIIEEEEKKLEAEFIEDAGQEDQAGELGEMIFEEFNYNEESNNQEDSQQQSSAGNQQQED